MQHSTVVSKNVVEKLGFKTVSQALNELCSIYHLKWKECSIAKLQPKQTKLSIKQRSQDAQSVVQVSFVQVDTFDPF